MAIRSSAPAARRAARPLPSRSLCASQMSLITLSLRPNPSRPRSPYLRTAQSHARPDQRMSELKSSDHGERQSAGLSVLGSCLMKDFKPLSGNMPGMRCLSSVRQSSAIGRPSHRPVASSATKRVGLRLAIDEAIKRRVARCGVVNTASDFEPARAMKHKGLPFSRIGWWAFARSPGSFSRPSSGRTSLGAALPAAPRVPLMHPLHGPWPAAGDRSAPRTRAPRTGSR